MNSLGITLPSAKLWVEPGTYLTPMKRVLLTPVLLLSLFGLCSSFTASAAVIFTNGASWKYLLGTQEASTPTNAWRQADFVETGWQEGLMPIGFAAVANDPLGYEATIRTTLPTGTVSNYVCVFLRKTFVVGSTNDYAQLRPYIQIARAALLEFQ